MTLLSLQENMSGHEKRIKHFPNIIVRKLYYILLSIRQIISNKNLAFLFNKFAIPVRTFSH